MGRHATYTAEEARERRAEQQKQAYARIKADPERYVAFKAYQAEYQKRRRASLTPEQKEKLRAETRLRVRRFRNARGPELEFDAINYLKKRGFEIRKDGATV